MIRVLVCGEGKHDIGRSAWSGEAGIEGWLQSILRKLIGRSVEFVPVTRGELVLQRRQEKSLRPLPKGHGAKALAAKIRGISGGYDLVVFMVDADSKERKEWRKKRDEIVSGSSRIPGVECVPCVPMSASESWLLADQDAWVCIGLKDSSLLPSRPERIWGARTAPEGNHPHQFFRRVCLSASVEDSTHTRVQIALTSKIETLRMRCPLSFSAFADATEAALTS